MITVRDEKCSYFLRLFNLENVLHTPKKKNEQKKKLEALIIGNFWYITGFFGQKHSIADWVFPTVMSHPFCSP